MQKKIVLDKYEQAIEDSLEDYIPVTNLKEEMVMLQEAAREHTKRRKSVTLRIHECDLEAIRIKASKFGVPYQTYINMLIHRDATAL